MREKLSHRRLHLTEPLTFYPLSGDNPVRFDVSFGFEPGGPVRECFSLDFKVGSDRQGEVHIACIIISVALQCGQSMSDLARIVGESDPGVPPQTMLGLIIRAGVQLDDYLTSQWPLSRARDIPKPATEAAAADEVERADPKGGQPRAYHIVGAEAGQKREPAEARAANVSVGLTAGETAPESNATPAGAVMAIRSGATGGESAVHLFDPSADADDLFVGECAPDMRTAAAPPTAARDPLDFEIPAFLRRPLPSTDGAGA